MSKNFDQ